MPMAEAPRFAAELLEHSAPAYAAAAASRMLRQLPATAAEQAGFAEWRRHLVQRVLELSAAVAIDEPDLFIARVHWSRKAFRARGRDAGMLAASLQALRQVLEEQLPPGAGAAPVEFLGAALAVFDGSDDDERQAGLDPRVPHQRLALTYLNLVLEGNVAEALACLSDAATGMSLEALYLQVLMPAQREIGLLWQNGDLSIPEEHLVTMTTQRAMAILSHHAHRAGRNGHSVIVSAVAGNAHDLALRAAADLLEVAGWRALLLGADVPSEDVPSSLIYFGADLLVLSATLTTQLLQVEATVAAVRERCDPAVRILVGGSAFDDAPGVWRKLGADAYAATLAEVTGTAEALLASRR
jgi:MerR family transcriptional regulator, light-induced transcriptional regulator